MNARRRRPTRITGSTALIDLAGVDWVAIDATDLSLVAGRIWHRIKGKYTWYAASNIGGGRQVYMHKILLESEQVDHVDGNGLNNRRSNLRSCTQQQNNANSQNRRRDLPRGVYRCRSKWRAQITVDGRAVHLGVFSSVDEASEAYRVQARNAFGEFAKEDA